MWISGFRRGVTVVFAPPGTYVGTLVPKVWDGLSVSSSRKRQAVPKRRYPAVNLHRVTSQKSEGPVLVYGLRHYGERHYRYFPSAGLHKFSPNLGAASKV
jgi:hypothetical protein